MNGFRLFLLAAGFIAFLAVKFFVTPAPSPAGADSIHPIPPKPAPSDSPKQEKPFPQSSPETALVMVESPGWDARCAGS